MQACTHTHTHTQLWQTKPKQNLKRKKCQWPTPIKQNSPTSSPPQNKSNANRQQQQKAKQTPPTPSIETTRSEILHISTLVQTTVPYHRCVKCTLLELSYFDPAVVIFLRLVGIPTCIMALTSAPPTPSTEPTRSRLFNMSTLVQLTLPLLCKVYFVGVVLFCSSVGDFH